MATVAEKYKHGVVKKNKTMTKKDAEIMSKVYNNQFAPKKKGKK